MARQAVGHSDASQAAEEADDRFSALGIDADGWAVVLRQAAGMQPAAPVPA